MRSTYRQAVKNHFSDVATHNLEVIAGHAGCGTVVTVPVPHCVDEHMLVVRLLGYDLED